MLEQASNENNNEHILILINLFLRREAKLIFTKFSNKRQIIPYAVCKLYNPLKS